MTEIVCKCGVTRLEDIQCAECGETFRLAWVQVSERLPDDDNGVLIYCESGEVYLATYYADGHPLDAITTTAGG